MLFNIKSTIFFSVAVALDDATAMQSLQCLLIIWYFASTLLLNIYIYIYILRRSRFFKYGYIFKPHF